VLLYRATLFQFKQMGVQRVYSYHLGEETGVSPEQVRKDFSEFKIKGNQRGGYNVDDLLKKMEEIFYKDIDHNMIIVGMGNIGHALVNYNKFIHRRINIVATFDIDPSKHTGRSGVPIYKMDRLEEIIKRFDLHAAIIAVPDISAQSVCEKLVANGITGIVNFAPVILKVPDLIIVNNVNLSDEIESVIYCVLKGGIKSAPCPEG
jgi:redox-sensing transcriptional repressor